MKTRHTYIMLQCFEFRLFTNEALFHYHDFKLNSLLYSIDSWFFIAIKKCRIFLQKPLLPTKYTLD